MPTLSVRRRVVGGFAVVLILLAIVAGVAWHGTQSVSAGAILARADSAQAATITELALQVREAHAHVLQYVLSGTMSDQKKAQASLVGLDAAITQAGSESGLDMRALATQYRGAVDATIAAVEARRGVIEQLLAAGTEIRTTVSAIAQLLEREADVAVTGAGVSVIAQFAAADAATGRLLASRIPAEANAAMTALQALRDAVQTLTSAVAGNRRFQRFLKALADPVERYRDHLQRLVTADDTLRAVTARRDAAADDVLRAVATQRAAAMASQATAMSTMLEDVRAANRLGMATSAGAIAAGLVLALLIGGSIAGPVRALTVVMGKLAGGTLDLAIPQLRRRDELGEMARAVAVFRDHMATEAQLAQQQEEARQQAAADKQAALVAMADSIEAVTRSAIQQVGQHTADMLGTADAMRASATRTGASAQNATRAADQALANAHTVAGAAEQLAASIREIGDQVSQSTTVVGGAVQAGEETRTIIKALNEKVGRIGAVADMISEIAAKTNLLALNATIEAARAGDAGKGFAVVAGEVKQLAAQTAASTAEIGRQIADVQAATEASVTAVGRIEETIGAISAISGSIAAAIEQQDAATAEISRSIAETAASATEMTGRISEVSGEAEETDRHAQEVRTGAADLQSAVAGLSHAVIHVVRTSSTEVDRRSEPRHPVEAGCRVRVGSERHDARLVNLSEHGAFIRGRCPLATGEHGMLELDGAGQPLEFVVVLSEDDAHHVRFVADAAAAPAVRAFLASSERRQAA